MEGFPTLRTGEIHTIEQWDEIKPIFIKLYKIEGKPLTEVRRTLALNYGFNAT